MSTILYKDKSNKLPLKYTLTISLLILAINLLAFYLIYSTYKNYESISFVQIDSPVSVSKPNDSLPGFDGERPNKAFSANQDFTDSISGLRLKYPSDWQVSLINGVVLVKKDACASSGGLIYPFYYTSSDTTPKKIGEEFSSLIANLPGVRGDLAFGDFSESNNTATSLVSGKICNQQVRGQVETVIEGGLAKIHLFWGNSSEFDNLKLSWQDVFSSFSRPDSVNYLEVVGENFQVGLPNNWNLEEISDGLNLRDNNSRILFRLFNEEGIFDTTATLDSIVNDFTSQISLASEDDADEQEESTEEDKNTALFEVLRGQVVSEQALDRSFNRKNWEIYWRILDFESNGKAMRALITVWRIEGQSDVLLSWRDTLRNSWGTDSKLLELIERTLQIVNEDDVLSPPFIVPVPGSSFIESLTAALQIRSLEEKNGWRSFILGLEKVKSESLSGVLWLPIAGRRTDGTYSISLPDNSKETIRPR